jgi:monofunctional biosynthetic peptidoglycan transglycosylase
MTGGERPPEETPGAPPGEDAVSGSSEASDAADTGVPGEAGTGGPVGDAAAEESPETPRAPGPSGRVVSPRRRRLAWGCLLAVGIVVLAGAATAGYELATWPDVAALRTRNPRSTAFIERYRRLHPGHRVEQRWVPYSAIATPLKQAVLVGEDINFFSHHGFDTAEIKKAIEEAWEEKEAPRGASTITQQLAKNLWLSPSRNPFRKLKEALLTRQLEHDLGKKRILELYLNVVEFGPGIFGAEAAAEHYYGLTAAELAPSEAAALAGGLPKPSTWHPGSESRAYARRVEIIGERMEKARFLLRLL